MSVHMRLVGGKGQVSEADCLYSRAKKKETNLRTHFRAKQPRACSVCPLCLWRSLPHTQKGQITKYSSRGSTYSCVRHGRIHRVVEIGCKDV